MLAIKKTVRTPIPQTPFKEITKAVLGFEYELSLVFISDVRMRALNRARRGIDAPTDILSFSITKKSGEIFISPRSAARKSTLFGLKEKDYLTFLFVHGCLHLKGMDHGEKMERLEKKWSRAFGVTLP